MIYLWLFDYLEFAMTYKTIHIMLTTPHFYLIVILAVMGAYIFDIAYGTFTVNVLTSIVSYIKLVVYFGGAGDPANYEHIKERSRNYFAPHII